MTAVREAVAKASKVSKRDGKWANKEEISHKIVGHKPEHLPKTLKELTEKGSIEQKSHSALWRPTKAGGGGAGSSVHGARSERKTGERRSSPKTERRTTRRSEPKSGRRTVGRGIRDMVGIAVVGSALGGTGSTGSVGGITRI